MSCNNRTLVLVVLWVATCRPAHSQVTTVTVDSAMPPPTWALLEREVLRANVAACRLFFEKYFDERGYLQCVERWGGNDGPDDAIECCNDWPLLHALGGSDDLLQMFVTAWEGHLRQYTEAKTTDVPLARDGMYFKEFPVMFDWVHNGEGLRAFSQLGLSRPLDPRFKQRILRFAGLYMNEDAGAPNYDAKHKIIRSLFNGSRGPLLRKATALDWAGDPIAVEGRFSPRHGEENYQQMLEHFQDYNNITGDHPQNLCATSLALYAYMLTEEPKYKNWLLEYVDAWLDRTRQNGGIIPTNIGLDGKIGSATNGKWYGGTYGWAFSVRVPQTGEMAHRNTHQLGLAGFGNAHLLTGDKKYIDVWRHMIGTINSQARVIDGIKQYPTMYGNRGWYAFRPARYSHGVNEIAYWTMSPEDRERLKGDTWRQFLEGKAPDYPDVALRQTLESIREKVSAIRLDATTSDTRLADDPLVFNPATATSLVRLMCGGLSPGAYATPVYMRFRYFDPVRRRAGPPADVAALVKTLGGENSELILVNINQTRSREVIVQGGAYGEHQLEKVTYGDKHRNVGEKLLRVVLKPGCGANLVIHHSCYVNSPTFRHPWHVD